MSPKLALIARKMQRQQDRQVPEQAHAPVDSSSLGEVFDALLQQRIDEVLAGERERHAAQIRQLTEQIKNRPQQPPRRVAKPGTAYTSVITHRDHLGRIWITETTTEGEDVKLITEVRRDETGSIVGSRTFPWPLGEKYSPRKPGRLPQSPARQYRDAEPR